ncbi:hypothetical protein CISIN_1g037667mg, partial [Citrus sinensis]
AGGLTECWNALMELNSCSNEIVIFFLNSQADISPDCCCAIDIITRKMWACNAHLSQIYCRRRKHIERLL